MRKLVPAVLAAVLLAGFGTPSADAGQIVSATGPVTVNKKQVSAAQPIVLKANDVVSTGPGVTAVLRSDAGDEVRIDANSSVRHEGVDDGVEYLFVERGTATGTVAAKTAVGCASGWATAPAGGRAEVRVEVPPENAASEGRFRTLRGDAWIRNGDQAFWVPANHSVTVTTDPNSPGDACFRTAQQNAGEVTLRRTVSNGNIYVRIPRATSGCVKEHPGDKSRISNDLTSNKLAKLQVTTDFGSKASAGIGPGGFALIDNQTGSIESFAEDLFEDLGDDASDFDTVESEVISEQRRSKR
jgi:hypothetical protein